MMAEAEAVGWYLLSLSRLRYILLALKNGDDIHSHSLAVTPIPHPLLLQPVID